MKKNKKDKNINSNGITISDSIVMSVRKKKLNLRKPEALIIAFIGYFSVVMAFLEMFPLKYNKSAVLFAGIAFSLFYGISSAVGKNLILINSVSSVGAIFIAYKSAERITDGYKFMYNTIYKTAYLTEIEYYKFLEPSQERVSVTAFIILYLWLMALIIYFFTVHHPNTILPLLITFPPIEIGLYHGIKMPIIYGVLTIAYWLALLSMTNTDLGEYSGGTGGFVRKENIFFPKRQMRLKVTEKCGLYIMVLIVMISLAAVGVIKITGYERSESINRKRIEVRDAVESFTMEDFANSISAITKAFGFDFKYESHKLGNIDHMRYKNVTDMIVTFDHEYDGAVYLKEFTCADYADNEWFDLTSDIYKNKIFDDFRKYNIYPQDFPSLFNFAMQNDNRYKITINSNLKKDKVFFPCGTINTGDVTYENSGDVSLSQDNKKTYDCNFSRADISETASMLGETMRSLYYLYDFDNSLGWQDILSDYCNENDLLDYYDCFAVNSEFYPYADVYSYPQIVLGQLLQSEYKNFVYANYLKVPENSNMREVKNEYYDIIDYSLKYAETAQEKIKVLEEIREKMAHDVKYSLDAGRTPSNRDFVNYFLLENKKGYCTHYATSGVILARMAGIPARYASGYIIVGEDFNDDSRNGDGSYTIELKDNRSHAWAEIYLDGYGWLPFEFTAGYSNQKIDTSPETTTAVPQETTESVTTAAEEKPEKKSETPATTTQKHEQNIPQTTTKAVQNQTEVTDSNEENNKPMEIKPLPESAKNIISVTVIIILAVILVWIRRNLMIQLRERHFTEGKNSARMAYMYEYAEKLIKELGISRENMQYIEYAGITEEKLGGEYFEKGRFEKFVNSALHSQFSPHDPTDEELQEQLEFIGILTANISEKLSEKDKLILKYVKALI